MDSLMNNICETTSIYTTHFMNRYEAMQKEELIYCFAVLCIIISLISGYIGYFICWIGSFCKRPADEADERRKAYVSKKGHFIPPDHIEYSRRWVPNSKGMLLYQQEFIPKGKQPPATTAAAATTPTKFTPTTTRNTRSTNRVDRRYIKGVVGLCHGFGDHTSDLLLDLALQFVNAGYAVVTMDLEGFGLSDGVHGAVEDLKEATVDLAVYFKEVLEGHEVLRDKAFFLYGVSMGGAVAFNLCTMKHPHCTALADMVDGVILSAPMVKVAEDMKPPQFVIDMLTQVSTFIPLAPIAPIPDVIDSAFKRPEIRQRVRECPLNYQLKPRLRAAVAMMEATNDISNRLHEFSHPVLIAHGQDDVVTSPHDSQELHRLCKSEDKTLKLYTGVWHDMLFGEENEQCTQIFRDMVKWLDDRC